MKNFLLFIWVFINSFAFSGEINWELLKTLKYDSKTKKSTPSKELSQVIGKQSSIKGFMMPLDYDAKNVSEFLFMPYIPACMHVPPPPPNNLIYVKMKKGTTTKPSFYPVELTGVLKIESNLELESGFKMEGIKIKELKSEKPATMNPF